MADPQSYTVIGVTDMGMDRPQPVVARMPTAGFHTYLAGGEVKLIVEHHDIRRFKLVEPHGLSDGLTGAVQKSFGLEKQHLITAKTAFGQLAVEFLAPRRKAMVGGNTVHRHEADIVPVARILAPRISEPDK